MTTPEERCDRLLAELQRLFATQESSFVDALLASARDTGTSFTLVWSVGKGRYTFGKSWDMAYLDRAFSGETMEQVADDIWVGEIDEPNGPGTFDAQRAEGLVANVHDVRWLDRD
ncbi:hypothetical protein [uncultured Nocardioides sp.]|uniref:hypothetical protein n=1 Tax=uncultured Nocardioides sp. TaxID=198441 RepID=UPI002609F9F7|nr:hypothetical protein [uncultured Nocardioides sp.]